MISIERREDGFFVDIFPMLGRSVRPFLNIAGQLHFLMAPARSSVQNIIKELSWVGETQVPSKCGCRDVRCGAENGRRRRMLDCAHRETVDVPREYFCARCREYQWNGGGGEKQQFLHCRHGRATTEKTLVELS